MSLFCGIDVGSRNVRVVRVRANLRNIAFEGADVFALELDAQGNVPAAALATALGHAAEAAHGADARFVALPGDRLSTRIVEIPAAAGKKLAEAIAFELEGAVPFELSAAIVDHHVLSTSATVIRAMSCAAPRARVKELLDTLRASGIDPREIAADPLVYADLVGQMGSLDRRLGIAGAEGAFAIVDIGHARTNVAVFRGDQIEFCRTLGRGGKHVTEAVAQALSIPFLDAERRKERLRLPLNPPLPNLPPPPTPEGRAALAALGAVDLLAKELHRTLAAAGAQMSAPVTGVFLCGGGARLDGLDDTLRRVLDLPVDPLPLPSSLVAREAITDSLEIAKPLALALRGIAKGKRVNFRKGEFAFRGDSTASRRRAMRVAVFCLAILLSYGFSSYARWVRVTAESEANADQLRRLTREVIGEETTDLDRVRRLLGGHRELEEDPLPPADAFDVVDQMSRRIPEAIVHDVEDLDVRGDHVTMRAVTNDPPDVDTIVLALRGYECFQTVEPGRRTRNVGDNRQKYSLDIALRCPGQPAEGEAGRPRPPPGSAGTTERRGAGANR